MNELVRRNAVIGHGEISTLQRVATDLAKSGVFKDAKQATQAFAKIMLGRDLGLSPTEAMTSIHIVEGKPELSADLQASMLKAFVGPDGERYDYRLLTPTDKRDTECEIEVRKRERGAPWEVIGTERFTLEDAERAGLAGKQVWKAYTRNMLFARAISNTIAFHCPEVTHGIRLYGPGEVAEANPDFDPANHTIVPKDEPDPEQVNAVPDDVVEGTATDDGEQITSEQREQLRVLYRDRLQMNVTQFGRLLDDVDAPPASEVLDRVNALTPDQADRLITAIGTPVQETAA